MLIYKYKLVGGKSDGSMVITIEPDFSGVGHKAYVRYPNGDWDYVLVLRDNEKFQLTANRIAQEQGFEIATLIGTETNEN